MSFRNSYMKWLPAVVVTCVERRLVLQQKAQDLVLVLRHSSVNEGQCPSLCTRSGTHAQNVHLSATTREVAPLTDAAA